MAATQCQQCGAELPPDAPGGVCPYCVLQLAGGDGSGWHATSAYATVPSLPSMEELASLFPQLQILEPIGRGGMGAVYKARQPSLDRLVALKILLPDIGRDPTFAERFSREARALARLNHPHIVSVYDSGHVGGLYYFLMEYVDGVTLRRAIQAGQITPDKALAIVPQICEALQYAHEEGVVHRDIKPENVLLDRKGRVKVADFGLAKLLGLATPDISLTGTRQAMGTLHYMAPEQYERPQAVDHRADIYSLGVVFYELLTGTLPLGRFALPSEKVQVDVRLDDVVLKSMEREPDRRYQYVSEVKTEMDSIAQSPLRAAPPQSRDSVFPPSRPLTAAPPPQQSMSDAGRLLIVLGILALAALPLLCGGMALLGFLSESGLIVLWLPLLLVPLLLIGGIVMIAIGLASKRVDVADPSIPPEKLAINAAAAREEAERALRWPAFGLLLVALIGWTPILIFAAGELGDAFDDKKAMFVSIFLLMLQTVSGVVMIVASIRMHQLQSYRLVMTAALIAVLPVHFGWFLGIPLGIWALVVLCRGDVRRAFGMPERAATPQSRLSPAAWVGLAVACVFIVPLGLLALYVSIGTSTTRVHTPLPHSGTAMKMMDTVTVVKEEVRPENIQWLVWTEEGPRLGEKVHQVSSISTEQAAVINEALLKARQAYLDVEKQHTEQKENEIGHKVFRIKVFSKELYKIENDFWTDVDGAVTSNLERGQLRERLPLRGELFPFGTYEQTVEIWQVGAWYHCHFGNSSGQPQKGPELPQSLKHLWESAKEPAAEAAETVTEASEH